MSDLTRYIEKRKPVDAEFALDFEEGYANFKIGVLLRQAREAAGLTEKSNTDVSRNIISATYLSLIFPIRKR